MSDFIEIPYTGSGSVIVNVNELKKIKLNFYINDVAEVVYYLTDEIVTQRFDYEYDPSEIHCKEWEMVSPCEYCLREESERLCVIDDEWKACDIADKVWKKFEQKYTHEKSGFNHRTAANTIKELRKRLGDIEHIGAIEGDISKEDISRK